MAYFMNSLKINNEYHVTTLCKITREDETHFFARPLKRDNFIRLINVTSCYFYRNVRTTFTLC